MADGILNCERRAFSHPFWWHTGCESNRCLQ